MMLPPEFELRFVTPITFDRSSAPNASIKTRGCLTVNKVKRVSYGVRSRLEFKILLPMVVKVAL